MADIIFGSHTFTSPDLIPLGLNSGKERFAGQQFISGGYRVYPAEVFGQDFTLTATLDTTGAADQLLGAIRWSDILALRAMPNAPQTFSHPRLAALGAGDIVAQFDKTSLDNLTFYSLGGYNEPINPAIDGVYPGADLLLLWYGVLNFKRVG